MGQQQQAEHMSWVEERGENRSKVDKVLACMGTPCRRGPCWPSRSLLPGVRSWAGLCAKKQTRRWHALPSLQRCVQYLRGPDRAGFHTGCVCCCESSWLQQ